MFSPPNLVLPIKFPPWFGTYSKLNTIMLQTYWNIGRRIVEEEQSVCDNLVIDNLRHRGSDTIKT